MPRLSGLTGTDLAAQKHEPVPGYLAKEAIQTQVQSTERAPLERKRVFQDPAEQNGERRDTARFGPAIPADIALSRRLSPHPKGYRDK